MKSFLQGILPRRNKKANNSRPEKHRRRPRPWLEMLEVREVLSTFAVQVFDDGVPVTGTTTTSGNLLLFIGSSADFNSTLVLGSTNSPGNPTGALIQMGPNSIVQATTTGTHTLTVELTSTDFSEPTGSPLLLSSSGGGEYVGNGSVVATYQAYLDPNDAAFGQPSGNGTPVLTATASGPSNSLIYTTPTDPSNPGTATTTVNQPNPLFSLTGVAVFTINAAGGDVVNLGATTTVAPSPVATPSLTTTPSPTSVTLSNTTPPVLTDTADLAGGNSPTGTITFTLYQGSTLVDTETANVNGNGNYTTPTGYTLPTTAVTGTYQWDASYSGDSNNSPASENGSANEQVVVSPASPAITTTPNMTNVTLGTSAVTMMDTAMLSGGYAPTGTITFTLYAPNGTLLDTEMANVSGNGNYTTPTGYTLPTSDVQTGTYQWDASYSGDSNNSPVSDNNATDEQVAISPASPTITTTPGSTVVIGSGAALTDSANLEGGYIPTGTITFYLFAPNTTPVTGYGNSVYSQQVNVNGNGIYSISPGYMPTSTGTYQWVAVYSGDADNSSVTSPFTSEPETVSPTAPAITTQGSETGGGVVGTSVLSDTAVLSGGYMVAAGSPAPTLTFSLIAPNGSTVYTETQTVTGDTAYTTTGTGTGSDVASQLGTYYWNVTYSGNTFNNSVTHNGQNDTNEQLKTTPATPAITTQGSETAGGVVGTSVLSDTANLTGGYMVAAGSPAPTITFTLIAPNGSAVYTETQTVIGDTAYTTAGTGTGSDVASQVGTYYWNVTYGGNTFNNSVTHSGQNDTHEQLTTTTATPAITTQGSETAGGVVGTSVLSDTANLSGGYMVAAGSPAPTITFTLIAPNGSAVYTETQTVTGDTAYTTAGTGTGSDVASQVGTYYWNVTYSGNTFNNSVTHSGQNDTNEQLKTTSATPAITTQGSETSGGVVGTSVLSDSAVLSGGYNVAAGSPAPTLTFSLIAPNGSTVYTETQTVTGDTTYSSTAAGGTSTGSDVATQVGTYYWNVSYNANGNTYNNSVTYNGQNVTSEQLTTIKAGPAITTTPGGPAVLGSGISISGTKYLDCTGNGFSADDTGLGGVTIDLYNSTTGLGTGTGWLEQTTTAANGTYSFSNLNPGTYYVQEVVPSGYIQTGGGPNGSAGDTYYTVAATAGHSYSGYNFDDFLVPTCQPTCISYTITTPSGCSTTYSSLDGNTAPGDKVTVTFTVPSGMNDTLTLVSYYAPGSTFSDSTAYEQQIFQQAYGTFAPGTHSLMVSIPNCDYQIDFICGAAINQLEPIQNNDAYGPDATEILYHAENRYLDSDSGGNSAPSNSNLNTSSPTYPTLTTAATSTASSPLTDSATLTGGDNPTGTITFYLMAPGSTSSTPLSSAVYTDMVTVNGDKTYYSGNYTPTGAGTYQWVAVYSGDSNNSGATSSYGSEPETVTASKATPTITTDASITSGGACGTAQTTDSVMVAGGNNPTGTITFTLTAPNGSITTFNPITINGDGTYSAPVSVAITQVGTYTWHATYSGDSLNNGASDNGANESVSSVKASPTISTNASITSGGICGVAQTTDKVTVAGGDSPTGTITFTLTAPNGSTTTVGMVTISGDGTYSAPSVTLTQVGTYTWHATYSGDSLNNGASDNGTNESVTTVTGGTITGTKYLDCTGDGFSCDDTPLGGVTIDLYRDTNGNGVLGSGDTLVATTTTSTAAGQVGTFAFTGLAAGTYFVQEVVPSGYVQTGGGPNGSAGNTYYTITITGNNTYAGNNFDDYKVPTCVPTNVCYTIYSGNCQTKTVSDLSGNTQQGEMVCVTFTVSPGMSDQLTLVSYTAPGSSFQDSTAYLQNIYDEATGIFSAGTHTLCVCIPNCYYQVDFVCGPAIDQLEPQGCGPDSYNITYHAEGRYIDSDNGGTNSCSTSQQVCQGDYSYSSFWCTSNGQKLINLCNGNSNSTCLGQWLCSHFPNLFGAGGCCSVVNSNGTCFTNSQIAQYFSKCSSNNQQVLSCALSIYCSSSDLCGTSAASWAHSCGFNTSGGGTCGDNYSVGTCGAAFGVANNTKLSVTQLLNCLNTNTICGSALNSGACSIFSGINSCGHITNAMTTDGSSDATTATTAGAPGSTSATPSVVFDTAAMTLTAGQPSGLITVTLVDQNGNVIQAGSGGVTITLGSSSGTGTFYDANGNLLTNNTITIAAGQSSASFEYADTTFGFPTVYVTANGYTATQQETVNDGLLAYTPAQIRTAYGINNLSLDGTGQTIAIVDAYDDPSIFQEVDAFDNQFGVNTTGPTLYQQYGAASSFLTVMNQDGQTASLPSVDPTGGWEAEEALDVEWVHAIAPGAKIVLVEANSQSLNDLFSAVATAAQQPNVSVVSMSWGLPEGVVVSQAQEAQYDSILTTPAGHQGVTFVTSTGDYGTADPEYPAFSPNVVAVGGTSLYLNSDNSYNSETGWGYNSATMGTFVGSGGGISQYEAEPAYQLDVQATGYRTAPDVSFLADPNTGVWMADTYNLPASSPWEIAGGTSLSAPAWAGLFAIANQGRVAAGESTLGSSSDPTATDEALYSMPQSDFNTVLSGTNGGFNASAGYNMVTGLGTPIANLLIPDLINYTTPVDFQANALQTQGVVGGFSGNSAASYSTTNIFNMFNLVTMSSPGHMQMVPEVIAPAVQSSLGVTATSSISLGVTATGLSSSTSVSSPLVTDVLPATASVLPSDSSRTKSDTSFREPVVPFGLTTTDTASPASMGSSISSGVNTPATAQPTREVPNSVENLTAYQSGSTTDDRQEYAAAPVASFTLDTAASDMGIASPAVGNNAAHVLDAVFMSFEQNDGGSAGQLSVSDLDGEVSASYFMPTLWMNDASEGVTAATESLRTNWSELTSPAIALLLAAGYTGLTASVAEKTERQRRSERFAARPQGV